MAAIPDNGLRLAVILASDDLDELRDYFADRQDVNEGGGPSKEMQLLQAVDRVIALHKRIIDGKEPRKTWPGYAMDGQR